MSKQQCEICAGEDSFASYLILKRISNAIKKFHEQFNETPRL